tara:strand:+ start:800 stop:916 length:117 start_codon:yes stop_codon:yes gene_type:complete
MVRIDFFLLKNDHQDQIREAVIGFNQKQSNAAFSDIGF